MSGEILLNNIRQLFGNVFRQHGYVEKEYIYDEINFGNSITTYESDKTKIRIIDDRGEIFVDMSAVADDGEWFDLNEIMNVIDDGKGKRTVYKYFKSESDFQKRKYLQISYLARYLEIKLGSISGMFESQYGLLKQKISNCRRLKS